MCGAISGLKCRRFALCSAAGVSLPCQVRSDNVSVQASHEVMWNGIAACSSAAAVNPAGLAKTNSALLKPTSCSPGASARLKAAPAAPRLERAGRLRTANPPPRIRRMERPERRLSCRAASCRPVVSGPAAWPAAAPPAAEAAASRFALMCVQALNAVQPALDPLRGVSRVNREAMV